MVKGMFQDNPFQGNKDEEFELTEEEAKLAQSIFDFTQSKAWDAIKEEMEKLVEQRAEVDSEKMYHNVPSKEIVKQIGFAAGYQKAFKHLKKFIKHQENIINDEKYYVPNKKDQEKN